MGFLGKLMYPLFGAAILFSYVYVVRNAIEPFQVSSEKRAIPTGPGTQRGGYRAPGVFFFGGFGGK